MARRALLPPCAAAVLALALLGCGEDAPIATRPAAGDARLVVTYTDGRRRSLRGELRCGDGATAVTGFLRRRDAARLCREVAELRGLLLEPPAADRICTELYGGPDRARIRGTLGARPVDRRFTRTNGCEISDWDAAGPLLPEPVGAGPPDAG